MQNLRKHINFHNLTIKEIFDNSQDVFSQALRKNRKINCQDFFKNLQDCLDVQDFFEKLGRCERGEQLNKINTQEQFCMQRIKEEREKLKEKARLNLIFYSFIGFAISLILV